MGPPISGAAAENGLELDQVRGVLTAVAPIVGTPRVVSSLSTPADEGAARLTEDELTVWFDGERGGDAGAAVVLRVDGAVALSRREVELALPARGALLGQRRDERLHRGARLEGVGQRPVAQLGAGEVLVGALFFGLGGVLSTLLRLGLAPVTVCTDLLKQGGYGRLQSYGTELASRMEVAGAKTISTSSAKRARMSVSSPVRRSSRNSRRASRTRLCSSLSIRSRRCSRRPGSSFNSALLMPLT